MSVYYSDEYLTNHDYLQHYGKKGMKWGVVNNIEPISNVVREQQNTKKLNESIAESKRMYERAMNVIDISLNNTAMDSDDISDAIEEIKYYIDALNKLSNRTKKEVSSPLTKRVTQSIDNRKNEVNNRLSEVIKKRNKVLKEENVKAKVSETVDKVKRKAKSTAKKAKSNINKGVKDIKNEVNRKKNKVESFIGSIFD